MRSLTTLALTAALVVPAGAMSATTPARPSIAITKATAAGGIVSLKVKISGFKMLPSQIGKKPNRVNAGHWHILVDGKYNNASASGSGKTLKLKPGSHRIVVELANNDHSSLKPATRSKAVTVTVA